MSRNSLILVRAELAHRECVWRINNHPDVRAVSFSEHSIPWDEHVGWFDRVLKDPERLLIVGLLGKVAVSVIRFDKVGSGEAEITVAVDPRYHGKGLGKLSIIQGSQFCFELWSEINFVLARIREENFASQRAFESAGYGHESESRESGQTVFSLKLPRRES